MIHTKLFLYAEPLDYQDYESASVVRVFDQQNRRQCLTITVIDDRTPEEDETFFVNLHILPSDVNVVISTSGERSTVTIINGLNGTLTLALLNAHWSAA